MRVRRQRLQVAIFPFLSVLLCVLGSLILLMLVLDRKVKLAAAEHAQQERLAEREKRQEQQETDHQQKLAERQQLVQKRTQELEERRRAEEERIKKEQDAEVRQHLAELQAHDDRRQKLKAEVEKLKAEETSQLKSVNAQQTELAALTDELRRRQEKLKLLTSTANSGEAKVEQSRERQKLVSKYEAGLHEQLRLLEQVIEQVKDANKKRPPLFYFFPPNQRVPGAGRPPIYLECTANHVIFQPDNQQWTTSEIQSSARFVEEVRRRQAAKAVAAHGNPPYVLLIVRPSATMLYYVVLHALQGTDIDMGYELVAEDWKLEFTDPRSEPPAEIAANRMHVAAAGPQGPRGQAPKIFNNAVSGRPGFAGDETSRPESGAPSAGGSFIGSGTKPGGLSSLSKPGDGNTAGANGGSAASPPSLAGGPGGHGPANGPGGLGAPGGPVGKEGDGWHATGNPSSGAIIAKAKGLPHGTASGGGNGQPEPSEVADGSSTSPAPNFRAGLQHGRGNQPFAAPGIGGTASDGSTSGQSGAIGGGQDASAGGGSGMHASPVAGPIAGNAGAQTPAPPQAFLPDLDSTPKPLARAGGAPGSGTHANAAGANQGGGSTEAGPAATGSANSGSSGGVGNSGQGGGGKVNGQGTPGLVPPNLSDGSGGSSTFIPGGQGESDGDPSATSNPLEQRPKIVGGPKPVHLNGQTTRPSGPRMVGGVERDWVIVIECMGDGISLPQQNMRFTLAEINGTDKPLLAAMQRMIQLQMKRQPDLRPSLKYRIEMDGLGTFYKVASELVPLGLPAAAERVPPPAKVERPKGE